MQDCSVDVFRSQKRVGRQQHLERPSSREASDDKFSGKASAANAWTAPHHCCISRYPVSTVHITLSLEVLGAELYMRRLRSAACESEAWYPPGGGSDDTKGYSRLICPPDSESFRFPNSSAS